MTAHTNPGFVPTLRLSEVEHTGIYNPNTAGRFTGQGNVCSEPHCSQFLSRDWYQTPVPRTRVPISSDVIGRHSRTKEKKRKAGDRAAVLLHVQASLSNTGRGTPRVDLPAAGSQM